MPPSAQVATVQTVQRPGRPGPKPWSPEGTSSCPESGSSAGEQTSDSFIHLPPGAQLPNPPEQQVPFPLLTLSNPPAPRRLSRSPPKHQNTSGGSKSQQSTSSTGANAKQRSPPAPSSWAVHFRGFVKAVKWSKSTPQSKTTAPEKANVSGQSQGRTVSPIGGEPNASISRASRSKTTTPLGIILDRRTQSTSNISPNAGGVFLVPHIRTQHELRPPTPGWMHPLPVNPYELSSARTIIGHESGRSRQSLDHATYASSSPPLADLPVRRSVSEIGHGSVAFAPLSPDASMSSLDHLPHFNLDSPDPSQEFFPRNSIAFADENATMDPEDQENIPIQPRKRFNGLKRALTFGRSNENRSTSDIPSSSPIPTAPRHRASKSADTGVPGLVLATPPDREGPSRLRRRSTLADATHSKSPSSFRLKEPPKFTLSPDASATSLLSTNVVAAGASPSPTGAINGSKPQLRRRLTKRKPSQRSRSNLPTTIEVETPKSVNVPNPMEALVIPGGIRYPTHIDVNIATGSPLPIVPRSAPPALGQGQNPQPVSVANDQPPSTVPPVPPLPPSLTSMTTVLPSAKPLTLVDLGIPPPPIPSIKPVRPPMPQRPSLERRASRRRWTLDVASEDIDDEVLKAELERLRSLGEPSKDPGIPDEGWTLARKALLSSREIILTERTYLNQLLRFMGDAALSEAKPPSLLMKHLPLLLSASQAFCMRLNEDPSAWGVSAAFVTVETVLESVLVDYCTVVGQIVLACKQTTTTATTGTKTPTGTTSPKGPLSKSRTSIVNASEFGRIFSNRSAEKVGGKDKEQRMPVSAWQGDPTTASSSGGRSFPRSKSMPGKSSKRRASLPANNASHSSIHSTSVAQDGGNVGMSSNGSNSLNFTPGPSPTDSKKASLANGRARATTAADIAIAPPQRVTRYVMLYKDLLNSTPLTAPSRPLVQRALDGALRIAERCNKAQGDLSLIMAKR